MDIQVRRSSFFNSEAEDHEDHFIQVDFRRNSANGRRTTLSINEARHLAQRLNAEIRAIEDEYA